SSTWLNHVYSLALSVKYHHPVNQREQRIVFGALDVAAGMVARAALADEDAAGQHAVAAGHLDAQALAIRLAAVANRALTLLMRHDNLSGAPLTKVNEREVVPPARGVCPLILRPTVARGHQFLGFGSSLSFFFSFAASLSLPRFGSAGTSSFEPR